MVKIKYEILAIEIDKLYPPHYILKDGETIEQHLAYIDAFIESTGWTSEEYIDEYIHRGFADIIPDTRKMN